MSKQIVFLSTRTSRIFLLGCSLSLCIIISANVLVAQSQINEKVKSLRIEMLSAELFQPFRALKEDDDRASGYSHIVSKSQYLEIDTAVLSALKNAAPAYFALEIPVSNYEFVHLLLYRVELIDSEFSIYASSDPVIPIEYLGGLHYRGVVKDDPNSIAAISVFDDEVMGLIALEEGNLVLGKLDKVEGGTMLIYNDRDLLIENQFECLTIENDPAYSKSDLSPNIARRSQDRCVRVYIEVNDDIVTSKGGVINAANYVMGIFNQSFTIYENDNVNLVVSEMLLWDDPSPYGGSMFGSFLRYTESFNGDIGHLVSFVGNPSRAASIGGVCSSEPDKAKCYSTISTGYLEFPVFSWSVNVVSHEMGHLLGSYHTHACVWNGNSTAIDGCSETEGACTSPEIPEAGGTIMSYCYTTHVGVNFNLGFGPQPGNVIRNVINAADDCLIACDAGPVKIDVGISRILYPQGNICESSVRPILEIENYGSDTVRSAKVNCAVGDEFVISANWIGELAPGQVDTLTIEQLIVPDGPHRFTARTSKPNGDDDERTFNDARTVSFGVGSIELTLTLEMDLLPYEIQWDIRDHFGEVLAFGGPYGYYARNKTIEISFCVPNSACLHFNILDQGGNGLCCDFGDGSYTLTESSTGIVLANGSDFGSQERTMFCVPFDQECGKQVYFEDTLLVQKGQCPSSITLDLEPNSGEKYFIISDIDYKLNAPADERYLDQVSVSYLTAQGVSKLQGVYKGTTSDVGYVAIDDSASSMTVSLWNKRDNGAEVSVVLSVVEYCPRQRYLPEEEWGVSSNDVLTCADQTDYLDSDFDGIADICDNCPWQVNPLQTDIDQNGVGDICEIEACESEEVSYFDYPQLSHFGDGSSISTLMFDHEAVYHNISFSISGIGLDTQGVPCDNYIEEVIVRTDSEFYAHYSGTLTSSAEIEVPDSTSFIEVELFNRLGGSFSDAEMSIEISSVAFCAKLSSAIDDISPDQIDHNSEYDKFKIYPNPSNGHATLEFAGDFLPTKITIYNLLGKVVSQCVGNDVQILTLNLEDFEECEILFVVPSNDRETMAGKKLLLMK